MVSTERNMGLWACGLLILLLAAGGLSPLAAQQGPESQPEKEFFWREIAVQARLEADGSISIRERQDYLFTGDYNGGERGFDLRMRQRLKFKGISRLDGDHWTPLSEGDLAQVDQYSWVDSERIRWRSRLPEDPPFERTPLSYLLEYRITNVVFAKGDGFALAHDFLFPDREAKVEQFTLDIEVDPAWRVSGEWQRHQTAGPLLPGQGHVVHLDLDWSGSGVAPVHRAKPPFLPVILLILLGILGGLVYLLVDFVRRQAQLGRFAPLPVLPAGREGEWLEQNLLRLRAEEVGAFWDRKVGPPEVAALIARWVAEGKVRSRVEEKKGLLGFGKERVLHLELLADRSSFEPYERQLLDAFFFEMRTQVDTEALKTYYKQTGFDPAGTLRKGLEERLARRPGWEEKKERAPSWKPTGLLFLGGVITLLADFVFATESAFFAALFFVFPLLPIYILSAIVGAVFQSRVSKLVLAIFLISAMPALYFLYLFLLAVSGPIEIDPTLSWSASYLGLLGYGLLLLAIYRSVLNIASSRETSDGIAWRKWLGAARRYLAAELRRAQPGFSDAFFPYLLAFGLERDVDRWFSAFGGAAAAAVMTDTPGRGGAFGGYSSSGSSGGGFTGGGGLFGGGGASASWAAAATSVASGVAAPSQSSSSGGSSGGSSSGGGSGGAW